MSSVGFANIADVFKFHPADAESLERLLDGFCFGNDFSLLRAKGTTATLIGARCFASLRTIRWPFSSFSTV